jgi:aromatic ring hydroxylase
MAIVSQDQSQSSNSTNPKMSATKPVLSPTAAANLAEKRARDNFIYRLTTGRMKRTPTAEKLAKYGVQMVDGEVVMPEDYKRPAKPVLSNAQARELFSAGPRFVDVEPKRAKP